MHFNCAPVSHSLLLLLVIIVNTPDAFANLSTWVLPESDSESKLALTSVADNVNLSIFDAETGKPVQSMAELGWTFENYKYGPALRAGMGGKAGEGLDGNLDTWGQGKQTKLVISNLPPGKHDVYIRYWAAAPGPDQMWYRLQAAVDENKLISRTHATGTLIHGPGGYGGSIYEEKIGTISGKAQDATTVTVRFKRGRHTFVGRFCGIRIASHLNAEIPQTSGPSLSQIDKSIRRMIMNNGPQNDSGKTAYGLGVVPSTLKVRPKTFNPLRNINVEKTVNLSGARGEWVSKQVILFSPAEDLQIKSLKIEPLTNQVNGAVIAAENILFAPVGFLYLQKSFDIDAHGWWPEPILTFLTENFKVAKGDLQSLWLRVHVPRDAEPGTYTGSVSIEPENAPAITVPVSFTVRNFIIPKPFSFRIAASGVFVERMAENGEDFLLSYGLNTGSIYQSQPPSAAELARWAKDGRVNAFSLLYVRHNYMKGKDGLPTKDQMTEWLDKIGTCLEAAEKVGMRDKAYFYMFDEAKEEAVPAMRAVTEATHKRFPNLLTITTSHVFGGHGDNNEIPYMKGWIPGVRNYDYEKAQEARHKFGRQVWWYTCNIPRPPQPNFFGSQSAMAHRLLLGFMPYAYKSDGYLYWRLDKYWRREKKPIMSGPYVTDMSIRNGQPWSVGAGWPLRQWGQIIQRGADGPLPSIRLECLRDGLEDYEYLRIAENLAQKLEVEKGKEIPVELKKQMEKLQPYFGFPNPLVSSVRKYSRDPDQLLIIRSNLARFIECARSFLEKR